ncbi:response regulator [Spirosoma flavus]
MSPLTKQVQQNKLLVIEDNADEWFMIEWTLQKVFPEVDPIWRKNAVQALDYLEDCLECSGPLPKLILLDLYLPKLEAGLNVLQILKTHYVYQEIPVVMLSISDDQADIMQSYGLHSNSFIVKPNGFNQWVQCLASLRHYWQDAVTLSGHTQRF